jgi:carbamoyltransferase
MLNRRKYDMSSNIIGICGFQQPSACCLLQNGVLKAVVREESFTRIKNDMSVPSKSFMFCLDSSNLSINDIDCIAYCEIPVNRLARQIYAGFDYEEKSISDIINPNRPLREIRELLGYTGHVEFIGRQMALAAGSYYYSGFENAAILAVDAPAEWETGNLGYGEGNKINILQYDYYPASISFFQSALTEYLGFEAGTHESIITALSKEGKPIYIDKFEEIIKIKDKGFFELNEEYFQFTPGFSLYSEKMIELLGQLPINGRQAIQDFHRNIAASAQYIIDKVFLNKSEFLRETTHSDNLCMIGRALTSYSTISEIQKKVGYKNIFIPPDSAYSWYAAGAAAAAYTRLSDGKRRVAKIEHSNFGPSFDNDEIKKFLEATSMCYEDFSEHKSEFINHIASLLANNKVIGWFNGAADIDPNSISSRAVISSPLNEGFMWEINSSSSQLSGIGQAVAAVPQSELDKYISGTTDLSIVYKAGKKLAALDNVVLPGYNGSLLLHAVDHINADRFSELINAFGQLSKINMLMVQPMALKGECSAASIVDAMVFFVDSDIDALVLGEFVIERGKNSLEMLCKMLAEVKIGGKRKDKYKISII